MRVDFFDPDMPLEELCAPVSATVTVKRVNGMGHPMTENQIAAREKQKLSVVKTTRGKYVRRSK